MQDPTHPNPTQQTPTEITTPPQVNLWATLVFLVWFVDRAFTWIANATGATPVLKAIEDGGVLVTFIQLIIIVGPMLAFGWINRARIKSEYRLLVPLRRFVAIPIVMVIVALAAVAMIISQWRQTVNLMAKAKTPVIFQTTATLLNPPPPESSKEERHKRYSDIVSTNRISLEVMLAGREAFGFKDFKDALLLFERSEWLRPGMLRGYAAPYYAGALFANNNPEKAKKVLDALVEDYRAEMKKNSQLIIKSESQRWDILDDLARCSYLVGPNDKASVEERWNEIRRTLSPETYEP